MNSWILICNNNYFDIKKALENEDLITWPLEEGVAVGDIVYFYVTDPYRAILYKCQVTELNLHHMDDRSKECVRHAFFYESSQTYMRLKKIVSYSENLLNDDELKKIGIHKLQMSMKIPMGFDEFVKKRVKSVTSKSIHSSSLQIKSQVEIDEL